MSLDGGPVSSANTRSLSEAPLQSVAQARIDDLDAPPPPAPPAQVAYIDLTCVRFSTELLDTIPREIAEQYGVLPVYVRKGRKKRREPAEPSTLYIATSTPADPAALEDCALCSNMKVRAFLAAPDQIRLAIPRVYAGEAFDKETLAQPVIPKGSSMPELPLIRPPSQNGPRQPPPPIPHSAPAPPPVPAASTPATSAPPAPAPPALPATSNDGAVSNGAAGHVPATRSVPPPSAADVASALANGAPAASESATVKAPAPPRVLVLGAMPALLDYCREALAPLGGQVEARDMGRAAELMAGGRPHLVLVPEEIYPFDRRAFNLVAFQLGAPLVVWSLDMDPADLQALLLASRCQPMASVPPPPA